MKIFRPSITTLFKKMFKEIGSKTQKDLCTRTFIMVSHSVVFVMSGSFSLPGPFVLG